MKPLNCNDEVGILDCVHRQDIKVLLPEILGWKREAHPIEKVKDASKGVWETRTQSKKEEAKAMWELMFLYITLSLCLH
jgi:hypothetical protein